MWSEYIENNKELYLLPDSHSSGNYNASIFITQLQEDGRLFTSNLNAFSINVEAVADEPYYKTDSATILEDSSISLDKLIREIKTNDTDGSEKLSFRIFDNNNYKLRNKITNEFYTFSDEFLDFSIGLVSDLEIVPIDNYSGLLEIKFDVSSKEISNESESINSSYLVLNVVPVADKPDDIEIRQSDLLLKARETLPLNSIFKQSDPLDGLNDKDGSEEGLIHLVLPKEIDLIHKNDPFLSTN